MAPSSTRFWRWLGLAAVAAFVGSILWSMWVDTLRPIVRGGDTTGAVVMAAGLAVVLAATGLIVWGGWRAVVGIFRFMGDPETQGRIAAIRADASDKRAAQRANLQAWWHALRPGLAWMLAGFAAMALGGWLINQ